MCTFFLYEQGKRRRRRRRGMHLPYHLFWPPVTETIWSRCQNLIREWKRLREVQNDWNKERGKSSAIWERRWRERKAERDRVAKREADKDAVEAKRKVEVKECEIWHSPLTQLLWDRAVQQISDMLMGKRPTSLYLPNPPTQPKITPCHSVTTSCFILYIPSFLFPLSSEIETFLYFYVSAFVL